MSVDDVSVPSRKDRPGDYQPLPSKGKVEVSPHVIQDLLGRDNAYSEAVAADLEERIKIGIARYGRPLETFNGRNPIQDAYEEALDLLHYLKQALLEDPNNGKVAVAYISSLQVTLRLKAALMEGN